jgi:hypothetical protein
MVKHLPIIKSVHVLTGSLEDFDALVTMLQNFFSLSLMKSQNKLERLSLVTFWGQIKY